MQRCALIVTGKISKEFIGVKVYWWFTQTSVFGCR